MWQKKKFDTESEAHAWMRKKSGKYQCEFIFGNNCCYVEYRKLRRIY